MSCPLAPHAVPPVLYIYPFIFSRVSSLVWYAGAGQMTMNVDLPRYLGSRHGGLPIHQV